MLKKNKEVEKETQRAAMKRFVCKLEATDLVRNLTRKLPRKQSSAERTAHERIKIITVMSIFILVSRAPILLACATKVILVSWQYPLHGCPLGITVTSFSLFCKLEIL